MCTEKVVVDIIKKITEEPNIVINKSVPIMQQVEMDSLNIVSFIVELEESLGVSIDISLISELTIDGLERNFSNK